MRSGTETETIDQKIMAVKCLEQDRVAISIAIQEDVEEIVDILLIKFAAGEISLFNMFQKWILVCDHLGKLWHVSNDISYAEKMVSRLDASDRNGFISWSECLDRVNSLEEFNELLEDEIRKEDLIDIIKTKSSGFYYS